MRPLVHGNALSILHVLAHGGASAGALVWAGTVWVRRRRAALTAAGLWLHIEATDTQILGSPLYLAPVVAGGAVVGAGAGYIVYRRRF